MYKFCGSILLLITMQNICTSQELPENDECFEADNCSVCISQYRDLEEYIVSSRDLVDKIREAFYRTGKHASKFVYITYNAQIGILFNQSNDTAEIDFDNVDDIDANCSDYQAVYIWSESPLYLLGPKPLFWYTLFAINIPETSVTIELPCLCGDVYYDLLSRLTYLVSKKPFI